MSSSKRAILLTSYMTGSPEGNNLGTPGYSYDFVTQLFEPLLARWGTVIPVFAPEENLDEAAVKARASGLHPIHVSFLPFQDVTLTSQAPNVVVPAWEFPDVPNEPFGDTEQNDWVQTAAKCDMILVGGQFTVDTFKRSGIEKPIRIVPVPTPNEYFELAPWKPAQHATLDCEAVVFTETGVASRATNPMQQATSPLKLLTKSYERAFRDTTRFVLGNHYQKLSDKIKSRRQKSRKTKTTRETPIKLLHESIRGIDLSGVVYTSIFNPDDGRKNCKDLLTAFLYALGDCEDATLVLKLITSRATSIERYIHQFESMGIPQRCKIVFVYGFLDHDEMLQLAQASTFYYQTTRAEGNCLPLMNYLGAGRPGISPDHSAIGDYFHNDMGYVIDSHPEPAAWPQDPRWRIRTTWGRMVWTSIVEQLRASYHAAKSDYSQYLERSQRARTELCNWASPHATEARLHQALDELYGTTYSNTTPSAKVVEFRASTKSTKEREQASHAVPKQAQAKAA